MDRRKGAQISQPYLLALNIALVIHEDKFWADKSWAKDLLRHTDYIKNLTLFCPVEHREPPQGWEALPVDQVRIVGYPAPHSGGKFLRDMPSILRRLWSEVGTAEIVHSGVAGWPIPLGWLATPMARVRGKKIVVIVESAFWRASHGVTFNIKQRMKAGAWEWMARKCLQQADYAAYTQVEYQRTLPSPRANGGALVQASWINAIDCVSHIEAEADWELKVGQQRRYLFASRMIASKGTAVIAEAIKHLAARNADVMIDVLGEGPQLGHISSALTSQWARDHVVLLDPVPYDARFLAALRKYHAILVPSLSDEQPRIIYDAFSQGVCPIASDSPGIRACVRDRITGLYFQAGDARALADRISFVDGVLLRKFGLAGLDTARQATHEKLHGDRAIALAKLFER